MKTQSLQGLLVVEENLATVALTSALRDVVSIVETSGQLVLKPGFRALDAASQVLAFLLGLRAAAMLRLNEQVSASAEEIARALGVHPQRAREHLSRLKRKFLVKTDRGWELPMINVACACDELTRKRRSR